MCSCCRLCAKRNHRTPTIANARHTFTAPPIGYAQVHQSLRRAVFSAHVTSCSRTVFGVAASRITAWPHLSVTATTVFLVGRRRNRCHSHAAAKLVTSTAASKTSEPLVQGCGIADHNAPEKRKRNASFSALGAAVDATPASPTQRGGYRLTSLPGPLHLQS